MNTNKKIDQKVLEKILNAVQQINYGEVVITIHNSKIIQIEKKEKERFDFGQPLHQQS